MNTLKKRVFIYLAMGIFVLSSLVVFNKEVQAANEGNPPEHIFLENIFKTPTGSNSQIINGTGGDIVQVTNGIKDQKGAVWSTPINKMNLNENFEASMYLYFGNQGGSAADGMAFVMHNDPAGDNTLSNQGGSIGVWAPLDYGSTKQGIKNSFAVEFDTNHNENFDGNVGSGNHIAWNYPGKSGTYEDSGIWPWQKRKMSHNNVQYPGQLSSDRWYSFSVKWEASTTTLTYQFEGQSAVVVKMNPSDIFGSTNVVWGFTGSTGARFENNRVVFNKVPGLVNATVKETIYNSKNENIEGKAAFQGETLRYEINGQYLSGKQEWMSVISSLQLNDYVTYKPNTLKAVLNTGEVIPLNDSAWQGQSLQAPLGNLNSTRAIVTLSFEVQVGKVTQNTSVAEMVHFKGKNHFQQSNELYYLILANQAPLLNLTNEGTTQVINQAKDYQIDGTWLDPDGKKVSLLFNLNGEQLENRAADSGEVNRLTNYSYLIPKNKLKLGSNKVEVVAVDELGASSTVKTLSILVLSPPMLELKDNNQTVELMVGQSYTINGTVKDQDSPKVSLFYQLNSEPVTLFEEKANPTLGQGMPFATELKAEKLPVGLHKVTVFGRDSEGLETIHGVINLKVMGKLAFTNVSSNVNYENSQIPETTKRVNRGTGWDISVSDTRGVGNNWQVTVTLEKEFTNEKGKKLVDGLIYVENNQQTVLKVGEAVRVFAWETKSNDQVAINWAQNQGLLLNVSSSTLRGDYQGVLSWGLVDGP